MPITDNLLSALYEATVVTQDGDKIGKVGAVYLDDDTQQPSWVTVKTGLFGSAESFVPLDAADVTGDQVRVPYSKDQVKDAPRMDTDAELSPAEEGELYRHYGLARGGAQTSQTQTSGTGTGQTQTGRTGEVSDPSGLAAGTAATGTARTGTDRDGDGVRGEGHDTSGPNTDDAMTRSEERVSFGTVEREAGRARLRKHIVTDRVTEDVAVSREEAVVEREPITEANRGDALSGGDLTEEEHEVTLHEERAVVDKETVPVERVSLGTQKVADTETVSADRRHEEIEVDGDTATRSGDADRR